MKLDTSYMLQETKFSDNLRTSNMDNLQRSATLSTEDLAKEMDEEGFVPNLRNVDTTMKVHVYCYGVHIKKGTLLILLSLRYQFP